MHDANRAELIEAVTNALWKLDGTEIAKIALIAGFSFQEIAELGGLD